MSIIQHKLFLIKIGSSGRVNQNNSVLAEINKFLLDENYEYINHSATSLIDSELESLSLNPGHTKAAHPQFYKSNTGSKYLAISLVYRDYTKIHDQKSSGGSFKIPRTNDKGAQNLGKPENVKSLYDSISTNLSRDNH